MNQLACVSERMSLRFLGRTWPIARPVLKIVFVSFWQTVLPIGIHAIISLECYWKVQPPFEMDHGRAPAERQGIFQIDSRSDVMLHDSVSRRDEACPPERTAKHNNAAGVGDHRSSVVVSIDCMLARCVTG